MAPSAATSGFINQYCLVRDHPIGDRLKFFIRQTRNSLGYSYGRLRQRLGDVEPKVARELVSNLLIALSRIPVAKLLPSRNNRLSLQQDIEALLKKLLSVPGFKPEDTKLWESVFPLVCGSSFKDEDLWTKVSINTEIHITAEGWSGTAPPRPLAAPVEGMPSPTYVDGEVEAIHQDCFGEVPDLDSVALEVFMNHLVSDQAGTVEEPRFCPYWGTWSGEITKNCDAAAWLRDLLLWMGNLDCVGPRPYTGLAVNIPFPNLGLCTAVGLTRNAHLRRTIVPNGHRDSYQKKPNSAFGKPSATPPGTRHFSMFALGVTINGRMARLWDLSRSDQPSGTGTFDISTSRGAYLLVRTLVALLLMDDDRPSNSYQFALSEEADTSLNKTPAGVMERIKIDGRLYDTLSTEIPRRSVNGLVWAVTFANEHTDTEAPAGLINKPSEQNDDAPSNLQRHVDAVKAAGLPETTSPTIHIHDLLDSLGWPFGHHQGSATRKEGPVATFSRRPVLRIESEHSIVREMACSLSYQIPVHRTLVVMESCIGEHDRLRKAGTTYKNVSFDSIAASLDGTTTRRGFLVDQYETLDPRLAHDQSPKPAREDYYMAIKALEGEPHSFTHELESFFWVLLARLFGDLWVQLMQSWRNAIGPDLARRKKELVSDRKEFERTLARHPGLSQVAVAPWLCKLVNILFHRSDGRQKKDDGSLYGDMRQVLLKATRDRNIIALERPNPPPVEVPALTQNPQPVTNTEDGNTALPGNAGTGQQAESSTSSAHQATGGLSDGIVVLPDPTAITSEGLPASGPGIGPFPVTTTGNAANTLAYGIAPHDLLAPYQGDTGTLPNSPGNPGNLGTLPADTQGRLTSGGGIGPHAYAACDGILCNFTAGNEIQSTACTAGAANAPALGGTTLGWPTSGGSNGSSSAGTAMMAPYTVSPNAFPTPGSETMSWAGDPMMGFSANPLIPPAYQNNTNVPYLSGGGTGFWGAPEVGAGPLHGHPGGLPTYGANAGGPSALMNVAPSFHAPRDMTGNGAPFGNNALTLRSNNSVIPMCGVDNNGSFIPLTDVDLWGAYGNVPRASETGAMASSSNKIGQEAPNNGVHRKVVPEVTPKV
ncbi:hypothetical protein N3K66_000893 [Trichothecium roseum]|uniref:Uncharacterized protein n=1 Tax=Trichothecium roseum TaxID=47278 RepID=A0ACC0VDT2_9HYPO|nr:hypothetical protein N3K66_000893 [Trichothecium roseum]